MSRIFHLLVGSLSLLGFFAFTGWLLYRSIRRSVDPARLTVNWVATLVLSGIVLYTAVAGVKEGPEAQIVAILAAAVPAPTTMMRPLAGGSGKCGARQVSGSAAAMAAAAIVTLADGTLAQALTAASLALQSMIGLICDPVANRVEAPCLGKNVMAAANALACANMALAGFDQVIPFDEVVATAKRVAEQMPRELRCTALGGLSITPTSLAIEQRLAARAAACGGGACGCR
jgi:hypothetical protein